MFSEMCHLSCIFHRFFGRDKAHVCLPKALSYHDLLARITFPPPRTESDLPFFCQKAQMTITELIKLYQWKTE